MLPLKIKFTWKFSSWLSHHAIGKGYRLPCMNSQSLESLGDLSEFSVFSPVKYSRILCLQICLWQDYSRTVESKRFQERDMTLHPPFRSAVSAYLIYPLIRYFSRIQQHYWLQNRRGLRPGASGKSRTGDCALLCAVLDTSPVVYNPQRLVHEVNNLWRSSQRAQRSNSSNLKTEKIWTYDRTYKELLLACAANCVAGTVAGTILAIT